MKLYKVLFNKNNIPKFLGTIEKWRSSNNIPKFLGTIEKWRSSSS